MRVAPAKPTAETHNPPHGSPRYAHKKIGPKHYERCCEKYERAETPVNTGCRGLKINLYA
ncbi:MAG: hypothetical protein HYS74_02605 [Parcubacteria group bacterium]|nr:hypothetical protein [Parcubacteria group bacterium]